MIPLHANPIFPLINSTFKLTRKKYSFKYSCIDSNNFYIILMEKQRLRVFQLSRK